MSFKGIKHLPKTQLLPQVTIKTKLHQSIVFLISFILIKTGYTIAKGKEMYFAHIKMVFKIREIHTKSDKNTLSSIVYHQIEIFNSCTE
jgi:hypothetical protein